MYYFALVRTLTAMDGPSDGWADAKDKKRITQLFAFALGTLFLAVTGNYSHETAT